MSELTEIRNGRVVTPTEILEDGRVLIDGSRISRIDRNPRRSPSNARTVDADGRFVMPGLIDLHGDDIETQLYPRKNARVDTRTALTTADRTNVLSGITTKFHAIAFEDAPSENRSIETTAELAREISAATYTLGDNRVHARCELVEESITALDRLLDDICIDLVSMMHHAPETGQFDAEAFRRHYVDNRNCSTEDADRLAAERSAISRSDRNRRAKRVASLAAENGAELASHDDETAATVDDVAEVGASISEYPLTVSAARRARELGLVTAMGAPNLVRGGSLQNNLSAAAAIQEGVVDILCTDYHPPSLLAALFVETGEPLTERISRATVAPAEAVGLEDRGRLEAGARADVLVVDPEPVPTADRVFLEGTEVFQADRPGKSTLIAPPNTENR